MRNLLRRFRKSDRLKSLDSNLQPYSLHLNNRGRKVLRFLVAVFCLGGLAVSVGYTLEQQGTFSIQDIRVELSNISSEDQVHFYDESLVSLTKELEAFKGQSLLQVSVKEVLAVVKNQNWFRNMSINRRWPHTIVVQIDPKGISALVRAKDGSLKPMLEDAQVLASIQRQYVPDVPVLTGDVFEKDVEKRKQTLTMMNELPLDGHLSLKNISEIIYDKKNGFTVMLMPFKGLPVILGEDRVSLKASRINSVLEYVQEHQVQARVIDSNLSKKVLVRLRKDP